MYGCLIWREYRLLIDDRVSPAAMGTKNREANNAPPPKKNKKNKKKNQTNKQTNKQKKTAHTPHNYRSLIINWYDNIAHCNVTPFLS